MHALRPWTVCKLTIRYVHGCIIQRHLYSHGTDSLLYQVAFKRFVDDIAVEAVETNLIARLGDILSPIKVTYLADDIVTSIAGESEQSRSQRKQLTNQLDVLVQGLETCKRFVVGNVHGTSCSQLLRCYITKTKTNGLSVAGTRGVAIRSARSDSPGLSSPSRGTESDEADGNGSQDGVEAPTDSVYEVVSAPTAPGTEEEPIPDEEVTAFDEMVETVDDDWNLEVVTEKKKKSKKSKKALS
jgi:hypothetical protein